ncbi:MgtC/SapB family protein [Sphingomonas sp. RS6]
MEPGSFSPIHLAWDEASLRICASLILPFFIGIERFVRRKPIDFRPFVIVSLGACCLSLGVLELAARTTEPTVEINPGRVFAGVITGIGFLGAGAMFREENYVKGAGSAASIWAAGVIGILCGIGMLWLAAILSTIILILLLISGPFTHKYDAD